MWPGPQGCDEIRHALGVYVLGAIDPAERTAVDRHLAACSACRDELAALAGLPALLGRLTLSEVESLERGGTRGGLPGGAAGSADQAVSSAGALAGWPGADGGPGRESAQGPAEPPAALLRSTLDEVARRRARRRRAAVLALAAAAVVLAGAGAAVRAVVSGPASQVPPRPPAAASGWQQQVSATDPHTNVSAKVRFSGTRWGTAVEAWVDGAGYGTRCVLWATDNAGRHVAIASWTYAADGAWYPGSSSIQARAIKSFDITAGNRTLVTVPVR